MTYEQRNVVLVCGGRDYNDGRYVYKVLDAIHETKPITLIVHGDAHGADTLAHLWAIQNYVTVARYPADWNTHGRAAGPIRNQLMLEAESPDVVIAFPGGRGTANMVKLAEAAGVRVVKAGW